MAVSEVREANQVSIILQDTPGELAKACEALTKANVNIEGICQTTGGNMVLVRFIVDNIEGAQEALESERKTVLFQRVIAIRITQDEPGVLAKIARTYGDANINIVDVYASSSKGDPATVYIAVPPEYFSRAMKLAKEL